MRSPRDEPRMEISRLNRGEATWDSDRNVWPYTMPFDAVFSVVCVRRERRALYVREKHRYTSWARAVELLNEGDVRAFVVCAP